MANGGWYGTAEEWARIEAPLLAADPVIGRFAAEFGLPVGKNHKDWPDRSIAWGDKVRCLIQLYLADMEALTFNLWLCASEDRGDKRYWKREMPVLKQPLPEFIDALPTLLRSGRSKLELWSADPSDFEFAVDLSQRR
jgi:hypothetical protein